MSYKLRWKPQSTDYQVITSDSVTRKTTSNDLISNTCANNDTNDIIYVKMVNKNDLIWSIQNKILYVQ